MEHYVNPRKPHHRANVTAFEQIAEEFPLGYFQPNPNKAPWHVQAILSSEDGYPIVLNFWPCAGKAQRDGEKSVEGGAAIRAMIRQAIDDATNPDGIDVAVLIDVERW